MEDGFHFSDDENYETILTQINHEEDDEENDDNDNESQLEEDKEDYKPKDGYEGARPPLRACETLGYSKPNASVSNNTFSAIPEGTSFHAKSFLDLQLSRPLIRACETLGYSKPTPIQAACIPLAMAGRDICASAITGSGKTAAFALPALERLLFRPKNVPAIRVLIVTPTRELALQVHSMIQKLAQYTDIRCCLVVGGLSQKSQETTLRSRPDIVVATPGRMIDHLMNAISIDLDDLACLILDEADRLLDPEFRPAIHALLKSCPRGRQTMLFSATMTEDVKELIELSLRNPVRLAADPSAQRPAKLTEEVVRIRRMREVNQEAVLLALCSKTFTSKVIIFSGTKQAAHRLTILFGLAGLRAVELHANRTQDQRLDALELFRKQEVDFLITTDIAERGLDITGVQTVINFECPRGLKSYQHRVGRTARAGKAGYAVTFLTDNDRSLLKAIAKGAGAKLKGRIVAETSIAEWCQNIEQMEDKVAAIVQEEREEMALRKAEMLAIKAENRITHAEEIQSRPNRTYFATEKEKQMFAKAAKESFNNGKTSGSEIISARQAETQKMEQKRKREREKNLPRRKRRKLEAAREMLEDENDNEKPKKNGKDKEGKSGVSLVDVAYRRAKAVKAVKRAVDSGKIVKMNEKKAKHQSQKPQTRTEEMTDMFQSDMSEKKQKRALQLGGKKKSSFKSKSRYKRK